MPSPSRCVRSSYSLEKPNDLVTLATHVDRGDGRVERRPTVTCSAVSDTVCSTGSESTLASSPAGPT